MTRLLAVVLAALQGGVPCAAGDLADAPRIAALAPQLQSRKPKEVRHAIRLLFGPPTRVVGSGLQIEEWEVDGGPLR